MSQVGFTPIQLYRSSTAAAVPTAGNLVAGELAINTTDEKLYFENASGVVKLLASSAATGGTFTTIANGLGAVGTPSYTFTGDLNTGIWSPAADTVAVSTAGAEAMRIISGGYVGIGTTAPAYLLDAQQTLNGTGGINYVNSSTGASSAATIGAEAGGSYFYHKVTRATGVVQFRGVTATTLNQDFTTQIFRSTGGTEYARIDSSGNVGIGTSAPGYKLDVFATGNISGQFKTSGSINALFLADAGTTAESLYVGTVGNDFRVVTGSSERMRVLSTGLVGIGTTAPGALLEVSSTSAGATAEVLRLNNPGGGANTAAQIKFNAAGANYASITGGYGASAPQMTFNLPAGAGNYVWQQASTESMRLDASGNVGIGTSSPTSRLTVASGQFTSPALNIIGSGPNQGWLRLGNNADIKGGDDLLGLTFTVGASERMRIDSSGNVGIGTSSPSYRLDVASGDTTASIGYAMRIRSNATATAASMQFTNSGASSQTGLVTCTDAGALTLQSDGASSLLAFRTNGNERMRISSAGLVGIGTSSPTRLLSISGGDVELNANVLYLNSGNAFIQGNSTNILFSTNATERMRIDGSGDVAIGTTLTRSRLCISRDSSTASVGASASIVLSNRNTTLNGGIAGGIFIDTFRDVANPHYTGGVWFTRSSQVGNFSSSSDIVFGAANTVDVNALPTERMRISGFTGNVGIGTSAPIKKLHVVGDVADTALFGNIGGTGTESIGAITLGSITDVPQRRAWGIKTESTNSGQLGIFCAASNSTGPFDGSQFVSIGPGGYVGLSVTTPVYQLQLSVDSAAKPSTNTWTIVSDSRIKTETGEYTKGLDAVCALRPITYHYNGAAGFVDDGKENISIIAQEAMQHFPECVGTFEMLLNEGDEEKTELFNWNGHALTFALVNAVKELKAVNDALTARVAQLEGK